MIGIPALALAATLAAARPAVGSGNVARSIESLAPDPDTSGTSPESARANTIKDEHGFQADLGAPGASTCFVFPEQRQDPDACQNVDIESIRARITSLADTSKLLAVALLRQEDSESMVIVVRTDEEMPEVSGKDIEKTVRGMLKGISPDPPGVSTPGPALAQPAQLLQVGPLQVMHLRVAVRPSEQTEDLVFFIDHYFVLTLGNTKLLQFVTLSTDMAQMQPVMEHVVQTLHGTPTRKRINPDAAYLGSYAGFLTIPVLLGLLVVGSATIYAIARRRKIRQAG